MNQPFTHFANRLSMLSNLRSGVPLHGIPCQWHCPQDCSLTNIILAGHITPTGLIMGVDLYSLEPLDFAYYYIEFCAETGEYLHWVQHTSLNSCHLPADMHCHLYL